MSDQFFDPPVRVALGRSGSTAYVVTTPARAAEILLSDWPAAPGAKHLEARRAVLAALERARDRKASVRARDAFEAAAEEAGILLPLAPSSIASPEFRSPSWGKRKRR